MLRNRPPGMLAKELIGLLPYNAEDQQTRRPLFPCSQVGIVVVSALLVRNRER
jgi:hypothetical protein